MKWLIRVCQVLLVIMVPFVVLMTSVRILLTPLTVDIEYKLPNIPTDSYGFTLSERTTYAKSALRYLTNSQGISFLGDQTFSNDQPLYNGRELSHMQDVKNLVQKTIVGWYITGGLIILAGSAAWLTKKWKEYWIALRDGGWATLFLILAILLGVTINFDWLFTAFHHLFFTGDSWLFFYSDTLIRLFPMEFWMNLFIALGFFSILFSIILIWVGSRANKRKSG